MSGMPPPGRPTRHVPFDARPLTDPVDRNDVRAFSQRLRASGAMSGSWVTVIAVVVGISVFAGVIAMFIGVFVSVFASVAASGSSPDGGGFALFGIVMSVLPSLFFVGVLAIVAVAAVRLFRGRDDRRYRLDRFARANGMTYVPGMSNPGLPGMIFGIGSSRQSSDLVRGEKPRFVEFGNYAYTTGSGKNRSTHRWGYVAVKLDVPLPHIVLDAVGNNSVFGTNLPATFGKEQRLSLEGDFDRYFRLYCPQGYESDALYLFTPDIMARFIDNAAALDVEIVDDWLFLYAKRDMTPLDPGTWAWQFSVVAALLDKFAQWARWRDDRLGATAAAVPDASAAASGTPAAHDTLPFAPPLDQLRPPPGVAVPGRRLQRRLSWISVVAVVAIVGIWLLQLVLRVLG